MGRVAHLARRFFQSVRAAPLDPAEQHRVSTWLEPAEAALFWQQPVVDQRHALDCALHVARRAAGRTDLVGAALLHDVGKRHARLGIAARVAAGALGLIGLQGPGRLGLHQRHGPLGAEDLRAAGASVAAVAFAAGHHGGCPARFDPDDWALLREADGE